jgi:hypothetical protein
MFRSKRSTWLRQKLQKHFKHWDVTNKKPNLGMHTSPKKILIAGIYLADRENLAPHLCQRLGESTCHQVDQVWAGVFGYHADPVVRQLTRFVVDKPTNKFEILNRLLQNVDINSYDFLVISDDDIGLPAGFLDCYIALQENLGFVLAQPARAIHSLYDHKFTLRRPWLVARRTQFVEIGPIFSISKSALKLLTPFDVRPPMGWGLDLIWPHILSGIPMGIIDAISVDHSYRPQGITYDRNESIDEMNRILACTPHVPINIAQRTLTYYCYGNVKFDTALKTADQQ